MLKTLHSFYPGVTKRVATVLGMPQSPTPVYPPPTDNPLFFVGTMSYSGCGTETAIMPNTIPGNEWENSLAGFRIIRYDNAQGGNDWLFQAFLGLPCSLNGSGWRRNTPTGSGSYGETSPAGTVLTVA